jgi:hypothetical protein
MEAASPPKSGRGADMAKRPGRAMKRRAEILHLFFAQANSLELSAKIFGP